VLEGKLHSIARLEKDKADLHAQFLLKVREIREAQAVPGRSQQEIEDRGRRVEQLRKEIAALETALRRKDPVHYRTGGLQQNLDLAHTSLHASLELQKRVSKFLEVENEAKRKVVRTKNGYCKQRPLS
jgi:hypothetical protein